MRDVRMTMEAMAETGGARERRDGRGRRDAQQISGKTAQQRRDLRAASGTRARVLVSVGGWYYAGPLTIQMATGGAETSPVIDGHAHRAHCGFWCMERMTASYGRSQCVLGFGHE